MNKLIFWLLLASRLLGALLSLAALFIAGFASDSGAADPSGARLSALMLWMPVVFAVCLVASWGLMFAKREKIALALSALPFLYFGIVILIA